MASAGPARSVLAGLAALLLVVACGDDDTTPDASGTTTSTARASTTTGPGEGQPPATTPGTAQPPAAPDVTSPGAAGPTETTAPAGGPEGAPVPPEGPVGSYGPWYLRVDAAGSIVLEVRSQQGAEPSAGTVDAVRSVLADVSGKPVSTTGGGVPGGARQWTPADIRAEADRVGPDQRSDAAVLTLLFVRGQLADADRTIGVAVRSDVAAVFSDKVDEAASPLTGSGRIEEAVTVHEIGHLLGLVDLVLDTGREDPEHPGHSTNRGSVMYHAVESTLVGDLLAGGPPTRFDEADRSDLRTIAGR